MTGLSVNENAVTLKTDTDFANTEIRIVEDGASQRITANNLLAPTDASVIKRSKKRILNVTTEALRIGSDKKAVSAEGNLGAGVKMQWDGIDKKAILTFDNGMPSTDAESYLFPFINGYTDANGLGQLFWLVSHAYLNKGKPVGGAPIAQNRRIITTDNITTATGENHVITITGHGFSNGQDIVPWCFSGHDGQTSGRFYGFPHSMGKTLYVEVLSADTFRLHRTSGLTLPLNLLTANFPWAGTSGSVTYASSVATTATYAQTSTVKTVNERNHGYIVGERAETSDGVYAVASVPTPHSFTYVYDEVTVTKTAHGLANGQWINQDITSGTGVDGWYRIFGVTTNTFKYKPFTTLTTNGDCTYRLPVVVTDNSHGLAVGDFVRIAPTTGDLSTAVYVITTVVNSNSYAIKPMELTGGTAGTGGNASVRRNMFALVLDAWDWHGHTSIETMWRDGTVNTMTGWTYGLNYPIERSNGHVKHFVGCRLQVTNESGTNNGIMLGRDHEIPNFELRHNLSDDYDLIRFSQTDYSANVVYRVFGDTGKMQVGGGDLQLNGIFNTRQTSTTVPNTSDALIKQSNGTYTQSGTTTITINHASPHNFISGQRLAFQFTTGGAVDLFNGFYNITVVDANNYTIVAPSSLTTTGSVRAVNMTAEDTWLDDVITTNATQTTLKSIPFAVGEMIMMDGWIEAKRLGSTDANTTGALFKFTALARRTASLGTELVGTPVITMPVGTIAGVTSSSVVIDAITGNFNIKVTGVASQNIQWKTCLKTSRL